MEVAPGAPDLSPEDLDSEDGVAPGAPDLSPEDLDSEEEGGLFSSSDEGGACSQIFSETAGVAASDKLCNAADLEGSLWELEDACNQSPATARLGALLISAEVRPEESCSSHILSLDLHAGSLAQAGLDAEEICEAINSKLSRIKATSESDCSSNGSARVIKLQAPSATVGVQPGSLRPLLQRIMEHLVDLPMHASGGHQALPRKRLRQTSPTDSDEREAFLDELCRERAEVHGKPFEEQQAFRERMLKSIELRRASALEEVRQVQERAAAAQTLTSRDRWLLGQRAQLHLGLLPWAKMASEQWWGLPEAQRQVFQAEAQQDREWLQRLSHARELQAYVEELDVFLCNLPGGTHAAPGACASECARQLQQ